jgi:peptidyl-tRNA hydrolase, PTH1 family
MALFQKRPAVTDSAPAYTVGATRTKLLIGLGNPEDRYQGTRHNIGFAVLDKFALDNDFPGWISKKDLAADLNTKTLGDTRVILCKPSTYMNESGNSAQAVQKYFRVYNTETLVVYDELALPFGQIRARTDGADAGHNGVKSLIAHLGNDFGRLRVGIASEHSEHVDASKFVLAKFNKEEKKDLRLIIAEASAMLTEYIYGEGLPHETRSIG